MLVCTALLLAALCNSALALGGVSFIDVRGRKMCTVKAKGEKADDTPNILEAFKKCGQDATVVFPKSENYWIATKLNPILHNVRIEWHGQWTLSDNLTYWRENSYPIAFQNHHAGFVISGKDITINGYGTGGINGNGDAWYNAEKAVTQPGRPMPFVFWNVSSVAVTSFFVKQSPLWALNIMNGTDMVFRDILCNSTAALAPYGANWVQNTDGFDTMDARNILLDGFTYQGGDDCIAIKPRSHGVTALNVTCHGGNGIAIGSLGQYPEDSSVSDVAVRGATILSHNADMHNSAYIKTWVGVPVNQTGYESGHVPRGGGWGNVTNLRFENFHVDRAAAGPSINQDSGNNGTAALSGSSLMQVRDVSFVNFTGVVNGTGLVSVSCSTKLPCRGIDFRGLDLTTLSGKVGTETCKYIAPGGVVGLNSTSCDI